VPRLWNCPPAAATESYIRDTTASLKTSLASPSGDPEEEYYRDLGYGGDIIEVNTRDWYLMSNSYSPLTGGRNTHTQGGQTEHHGDDVCGGSCVVV
jgi:hypothetical protein